MTSGGGQVMPHVTPDFGAPDRDEEKTSYDSDEAPVCPPHTTERKLMMKIDARVVPFLCIMYLLAFLDRVNIANANVFDLSKDLKLIDPHDPNGTKYNNALVIFFVPYCLLEIPSNILLKKFKPHVWLSINMFLFGLTTMCQGFVQNYGGLLATRFFLGVFETGMFPGAFYLIGMWYKRSEAQRRYSFFFNSTTLAGAFGGLLAAAIGKMSGLRGYSGWRWIFILEGLLTVIVAIFFFFLLPDFPEDVKWLDEEERKFVKARLRADVGRSAAARKVTMKDVKNTLLDWKIIAGGFCYFGLIVPAYGYAYFAPAIIQKLGGYGAIQTQLMSVPPWAFAFVFSMVIATISDKTRHRVGFAVLTLAVAIAGFAMLLKIHDRTTIEYIALFFVTSGAYTAMPIIVCWFNMNLGGHHRRSIGSAWQVGFGNLGGIIAVFAFLNSDKVNFYAKGHTICLAFCALSFLSCMVYGYLCLKSNRERDAAPPSTLTEEEKEDLGDHSPDYRYLL